MARALLGCDRHLPEEQKSPTLTARNPNWRINAYRSKNGLPLDVGDFGDTQTRAQILGSEGQNVAQPVAVTEGNGSAKSLVNDGLWRTLAQVDAAKGLERAKGFEPSTLTLAT